MPDAEIAAPAAANGVPAPAEPAKPEEVKPPSPKEDPKQSARFALLARKEQHIVREKETLKRERAEFESQRKEIEALKAKLTGAKDPIAALEAQGYTYEQATQFVLNDKKPTADLGVKAVRDDMDAMKAELERLKAERAAEEKKAEAARERKIVDDFNADYAAKIKAGGDKFELVNLYEEYGLVTALVEQHYGTSGQLLSADEAGTLAESYLEERISKAKSAKKFSAAIATKPQPAAASEPGKGPARTMTNSLGTTASTEAQPIDPIERALAKWGQPTR